MDQLSAKIKKKHLKNTGRVKRFCQSGKVRTMTLYYYNVKGLWYLGGSIVSIKKNEMFDFLGFCLIWDDFGNFGFQLQGKSNGRWKI